MSWRAAFLLQAKSDNQVRRRLNEGKVAYCHQLHYLQMTTEKLAKALLTQEDASKPPAFTHALFVKSLRALKTRPDIRRLLGYARHEQFLLVINGLLPMAERVERLAPSIAGGGQPNPEYPWQANNNHPVVAPVEFSFAEFDPRAPQMAKLLKLVEDLLAVLT